VGPVLSFVRPPVQSWLEIGPIRSADIDCETFPIPDLPHGELIRLVLGQAPREGVAVEVLEMSSQLAEESAIKSCMKIIIAPEIGNGEWKPMCLLEVEVNR
jgi:hypothetical protein